MCKASARLYPFFAICVEYKYIFYTETFCWLLYQSVLCVILSLFIIVCYCYTQTTLDSHLETKQNKAKQSRQSSRIRYRCVLCVCAQPSQFSYILLFLLLHILQPHNYDELISFVCAASNNVFELGNNNYF